MHVLNYIVGVLELILDGLVVPVVVEVRVRMLAFTRRVLNVAPAQYHPLLVAVEVKHV